ncbi:hypothetical protein LTS10_012127 [Elasticomyces elasticus]|nr:hypothetical protein LTS10_012127 [Elasticomyces elasticus]
MASEEFVGKMRDVEMLTEDFKPENYVSPSLTSSPFQFKSQPYGADLTEPVGVSNFAIETPFLDYDWLLSRNNDLHRLVSEQGKRSQDQVLIFNDVWQRLNQMTRAKEQIDWQRQALWGDNIRLKSELAQTQHTLAVDRFQHAEQRKTALLRDELMGSLRQEASSQRESARLTTEHLAQMTRVLTVALHAPGSEEARLLLASSYEAQLKENQRLREELSALSNELSSLKFMQQQQHQASTKHGQNHHTSLPQLAPRPDGCSRAAARDEQRNATIDASVNPASVHPGFNDSVSLAPLTEGWVAETPARTKEQPARKYVKAKKGKGRVPSKETKGENVE